MSEELENSVAPDTDTRTDADLDKLADHSEKATNRDRPMVQKEPEKASAKGAAEDVYEFVHNGKPVKGTREQILKWAQQGYDYPQKAQKLNLEKAKWEEERQKFEKDWGVYREIDAYARTNQDWWNHIVQSWQNKGAVPSNGQNGTTIPPQNDPYAQKFQTLEQQLSQIVPLVQTFAEEKAQIKQRELDAQLDRDIQSIQGKYPDLDWKSLNEDGKSLETRVLEHAQSKGIQEFSIAFRDLLHDELMQRAEAGAKLAVSRGIQTKTKLGVLGESPTPTKGFPAKNRDMRKTSYEELEADIREELRQMRS